MMADNDKSTVEGRVVDATSSVGMPNNGAGARLWMRNASASRCGCDPLNADQSTSISAMIAYISSCSGQSEFALERRLSDRFNIPNPKCLSASDYDEAIKYLADIMPS